jgi:RNA polymerase sigma-70 factor (TIGR02960 family)
MDEQAFALLIEPHRRALHLHCYRMLGSLHDADDALQETLLRAWKGSDRYEPRAQLGTWLHAIATNVCLTAIARRRARPAEVSEDLEHLQPYPDRLLEDLVVRETVELAFITAIQLLPPKQRAVLILREVLGWSAKEAAETLDDSVAAVNSALQRARKTVGERLPARSQQATLCSLGDDGLRDLVEGYISAWESRDVDEMVAMLVEDATFAMPPHPHWWSGRDAVVGFLSGTGKVDLRHIPTRANGQPAIGWYIWNAERDAYIPASLEVLTVEGARVREITAFVFADLFPRFGLPVELPRTR